MNFGLVENKTHRTGPGNPTYILASSKKALGGTQIEAATSYSSD
jgi:hypothetical protein